MWRWDQGEPFGNDVPNNNPSGAGAFDFALRFPGQYFDQETGLAYNVRRDYDPRIGRYVETDPIGLLAGLNPYLFVSASPLRYIDVIGLDISSEISGHITAGMAGGLLALPCIAENCKNPKNPPRARDQARADCYHNWVEATKNDPGWAAFAAEAADITIEIIIDDCQKECVKRTADCHKISCSGGGGGADGGEGADGGFGAG